MAGFAMILKKLRFMVALAAGIIFVYSAFSHYNDCYSAILRSNESWLHTQARFYLQEMGKAAPNVRDHVSFVGEVATEVSVLTKNDPFYRDVALEDFRSATEVLLEKDSAVVDLRKCGDYGSDDLKWTCLEWSVRFEHNHGVQRAYFTARGSSKVVVLFTAVPQGRFEYFGRPTGWLDRLEWQGPSILYSY